MTEAKDDDEVKEDVQMIAIEKRDSIDEPVKEVLMPKVSEVTDVEREKDHIKRNNAAQSLVEIKYQFVHRIKQLELKIQEDKDEKQQMKEIIDQLKAKNISESSFGGFTQNINKKPFRIPSERCSG